MISMDMYAYNSKLKNTDAIQKLFFALLTLSVCLWADNGVISSLVLLMMGGSAILIGGTPIHFYIKIMLIPMTFLIIGLFTIAISIAEHPNVFLLSLPIANTRLGITYNGASTAFGLFLKSLGSVSCLYFLSLTTPMIDILATLKKLKVPKLLIEIMGLVYRFIFVLLETSYMILTAQNSRMGYSSLKSAFRSIGTLASTLFIRAYKRSNDLYTALESRGYNDELNVLIEPKKRHWIGYALPLCINVLLIITATIIK